MSVWLRGHKKKWDKIAKTKLNIYTAVYIYIVVFHIEKAKKQIEYLDGRKLFINYANKKKDTKIKKSLSHKVIQDNTKTEEHDVTQENIKTEEKITEKSCSIVSNQLSLNTGLINIKCTAMEN